MSLAAVSQVASSIGGLKSRYLKYLEAFCAANGIEVADVKVCAQTTASLVCISHFPLLSLASLTDERDNGKWRNVNTASKGRLLRSKLYMSS